MALTNCRECGQQVSTEATACPHCGAPSPARPSLGRATPDASQPRLGPPQPKSTVPDLAIGCLLALGVLVVIIVAGLTGAPQPGSPKRADDVPDRKDGFEASSFCQQHACKSDGQWLLQGGGVNHAYRIDGDQSILIELARRGSELFHAGIGLYGKERLRPDFPRLASDFLVSVIGECPAVARALRNDLSRKVSGVMAAPAHECGAWKIRAGRVLASYVISAER